MKPSQTVLLLILVVAIVFGVTFAMMYVGKDNTAPPPKRGGTIGDASAHLTFPVRLHPQEGADSSQRIATEFGTKGHSDFWFENTNDGEVRVGLNSKNCTCSDVQLFLAPEGWRGQVSGVLATQAVAGCGGVLPGLLIAVGAEKWAEDLAANEDKGYDLAEKDGTSVPAHGFGFVRLRWEARRTPQTSVKAEKLSADLWMQDPRTGGSVILEAGALLLDGLRIDTDEFAVGVMGSGDAKQQLVRVWTSTRHHLEEPRIEVTGGPFVSCSQPTPLTRADIEELTERGGPVRAGYRMTIHVREQLPDGERIDEGLFNHQVKIRPRERFNLLDSLNVRVHGTVKGDFSIAGMGAGIDLGTFEVRYGTSHSIAIQTERDDLSLTVEKEPSFLKAKLSEPKQMDGRRTWTLTVDIAKDQVSGSFPRADHEAYRDSAVYLKVDGAVKRKLRIPVKGYAKQ